MIISDFYISADYAHIVILSDDGSFMGALHIPVRDVVPLAHQLVQFITERVGSGEIDLT